MNSNKRWQHVLRGTVAVLSLALLSSCGGGKREAFHPNHMYMFGDEFTYIDYNDSSTATYAVRYTVNTELLAYAGPPVAGMSYNSLVYPSWVEFLSAYYGKTQDQCSSTSAGSMSMCSRNTTGSQSPTVADTINQINTKAFQKDELVVIMAGTRDILNAYKDFKNGCGGGGCSIDSLATTVKNSGIALGQKINAITDTGARVAVATIPDIGLSPYAISEAGGIGNLRNYGQAMDCSTDYRPNPGEYSKALSYLTACFNSGLRGINGIKNDGKKIALISTFDWTVLVARSPATYGIADAVNAACTSVANSTTAIYTPTDCLSTNAVSNPLAYLWSFGPWFGPGGHVLLGQRAINQVNLNWGE